MDPTPLWVGKVLRIHQYIKFYLKWRNVIFLTPLKTCTKSLIPLNIALEPWEEKTKLYGGVSQRAIWLAHATTPIACSCACVCGPMCNQVGLHYLHQPLKGNIDSSCGLTCSLVSPTVDTDGCFMHWLPLLVQPCAWPNLAHMVDDGNGSFNCCALANQPLKKVATSCDCCHLFLKEGCPH